MAAGDQVGGGLAFFFSLSRRCQSHPASPRTVTPTAPRVIHDAWFAGCPASALNVSASGDVVGRGRIRRSGVGTHRLK
jgi:hypothetical protein